MNYTSGGNRVLYFGYVVQASDVDSSGISIGAGALTLNGGTITLRGSSTTNANLGLGSHAIADSRQHLVDGSRIATPGVTSVLVTSRPAAGDTYRAGENIRAYVEFNPTVTLSGNPQLALSIGSQTRHAAYTSTYDFDGTRLYFSYTVQASDVDANGISIGASALTLNGGTITLRGSNTTNANLSLGTNGIANSGTHRVNGSTGGGPVVDAVRIETMPANDSTYQVGEHIRVSVTFDREVALSGANWPQLALTIGSRTRQVRLWGTRSARTYLKNRDA